MYSHIFFDHNLRRKEEEKKLKFLYTLQCFTQYINGDMTTTTHYYGVLYIFSHNKFKHKEKYERRHKIILNG